MDSSGIRPTTSTDATIRIGQSSRNGTAGQAAQTATAEAAGAKRPASLSSSTRLAEAWMAELPLSVLRDEEALMAEWAWRREISTLSQLPDSHSGSSMANQSLDNMRTLWSTLEELSSPAIVNVWQGEVSALSSQHLQGQNSPVGSLLDFAMLATLPANWPDHVKKQVLRNRLLSSVSDNSQTMRGEGLFIPGMVALPDGSTPLDIVNDAPKAEKRHSAVRWKAESHSVPLSDGRMVHRVVIETRLDGEVVFVTLLSSHPSLSVHIETDHVPLRRACESAQPLRDTLTGLGWHIERWSVSSLREEEN